MESNVPPVAFLGLCSRAALDETQGPYCEKYNVLGLRVTMNCPIFPFSLRGFYFALGLFNATDLGPVQVRLMDPDGREVMHAGISMVNVDGDRQPPRQQDIPAEAAATEPGAAAAEPEASQRTICLPVPHGASWTFVALPTAENAMLTKPGLYPVTLVLDGEESQIGTLGFGFIPSPPLDAERIAAIKADPFSSSMVRIDAECNKCQRHLLVYCAIDRSHKEAKRLEQEGYVWYQDLPQRFTCDCGGMDYDLQYLRANMHALHGARAQDVEQTLSFTRLYEKSTLDGIRVRFARILDAAENEEEIQQFISENLILLAPFSPIKIFRKAPILTKYKTDFAILTPKRELLLVEIERPNRQLLKKKGGVAAELQTPLDQIADWLHEAREHRAAVLDCIGLDPKEVSRIRGIAIIGRDREYDSEELRKLKSHDFGETQLFTYDDVLGSLSALIEAMAAT